MINIPNHATIASRTTPDHTRNPGATPDPAHPRHDCRTVVGSA